MLEGGEDPRFLARRIVIARERGRRQRRSAGARRGRRRRAGARARRAAGGAAQPRAGGDLRRTRAEVERLGARDLGGAGGRATRRDRHAARRPCCATRTTGARAREATAPATSRPTTIRRLSAVDHLPEGLRGRTYYRPVRATARRVRRVAIATGDRAPEFDLEETAGEPRVRLSDYHGRSNVLLVFHPFAFTAVCTEEAQRSAGEPRLVSQREHGDRVRLVRRLGGPAGLEGGARRRVHVRLRLLVARRGGEALRRLQRGDRCAGARHVPDRPGRGRDLVARRRRDERRTEMVPGSLETLRKARERANRGVTNSARRRHGPVTRAGGYRDSRGPRCPQVGARTGPRGAELRRS